MTREDVIRLMPQASEDTIRRTIENDNAANTKRNTGSKLQKQQTDNHAPKERSYTVPCVPQETVTPSNADNTFRLQSMDAGMPKKFRITITARFSDKRAHDINGSASTLLDVIRDAAKQLAAESPEMEAWINQNVPLDDSWLFVPELIVRAEACEKGNEGASVSIEAINQS